MNTQLNSLIDFWKSRDVVILDGATGSELNHRGVSTELPLWSTHALISAPETLFQIHKDYVEAGAKIVTANTFRTHRRNLVSSHMANRAAEFTRQAVEIARNAAGERAWVAGSLAPLEDCYTPEAVPTDRDLKTEHEEMARNLTNAGVDLILVETQNTIREAVAASLAVVETEIPFVVSFVLGTDGRLLSGETLADAVLSVMELEPLAVSVNCLPAEKVLPAIAEIRGVNRDIPIGAYANIGKPDPVQGWIITDAQNPQRYADYAMQWVEAGAKFVGGCCGTTPGHIRGIIGKLIGNSLD